MVPAPATGPKFSSAAIAVHGGALCAAQSGPARDVVCVKDSDNLAQSDHSAAFRPAPPVSSRYWYARGANGLIAIPSVTTAGRTA